MCYCGRTEFSCVSDDPLEKVGVGPSCSGRSFWRPPTRGQGATVSSRSRSACRTCIVQLPQDGNCKVLVHTIVLTQDHALAKHVSTTESVPEVCMSVQGCNRRRGTAGESRNVISDFMMPARPGWMQGQSRCRAARPNNFVFLPLTSATCRIMSCRLCRTVQVYQNIARATQSTCKPFLVIREAGHAGLVLL